MRYAEGTSVPVERSKAEIERLLTKYSADQFAGGWTDDKAIISFRMNDRYVRIEMPLAVWNKTRNRKGIFLGENQCAQENRRRWRSMVLYIKSKLDSVESEIVSFEEAFMAHIVLPNRQTVGQALLPQIANAYGSGKMPPLLGYDG